MISERWHSHNSAYSSLKNVAVRIAQTRHRAASVSYKTIISTVEGFETGATCLWEEVLMNSLLVTHSRRQRGTSTSKFRSFNSQKSFDASCVLFLVQKCNIKPCHTFEVFESPRVSRQLAVKAVFNNVFYRFVKGDTRS